jgi:NAD(P)-dependent dehydrogenase (short-subunit alcohol dehydrogenase family)
VRLHEAVGAALERARGSFIAIASQAGLVGEANNGAYCAAKFALVGWARMLAAAQPETGVRVRTVCPGCVDTPLLRDGLAGMARDAGVSLEAITAQRVCAIPGGRPADPADIAALVTCLSHLAAPAPAVAPATGGEVLF